MTKNTAHANCSHPSTKSARSACRRAARKITVQNPTANDMIGQLIGSGRAVSEANDRARMIADYAYEQFGNNSGTARKLQNRIMNDARLNDKQRYTLLTALSEQSGI